MKIFFQLFVVIILIPTSLYADSNKSNHQYQRIHFCTDFYFDAEYDEYRQACFSLIEDANNQQTDVAAYIKCQPYVGDCDGDWDYRAYCQTDKAGPGVIQVANKNQIIVDLQPEDCDYALNSIGSQFSATANGIVKERFDYGNYFLHSYQLDRQCIIQSKGGSQEARLADIEAVIEGKAVVSTAYIYTITTDSLRNPCGLPW